jgi:hypothetical protein
MSKSEVCECCGAKVVEYMHSLNKPMVESLLKLRVAGWKANIDKINLTSNQRNNFQKLQYWGLVEKYYEGGERKAGVWKLTIKGGLFLDGEIGIQRHVITYRGKVRNYLGDEMNVSDFVDVSYWQKKDYIETSRPVGSESPGLFDKVRY